MNGRIGLIRASIVVVAIAVLGPAVAQSQILIICETYRDSHADTGNNVCHGRGRGCMECTIFELSTTDEGERGDTRRQAATVASYAPRLLDGEAVSPVGLASSTGLRFTPAVEPVCEAPALFDQVRAASWERVSPAVKDRSRSRVSVRVAAR